MFPLAHYLVSDLGSGMNDYKKGLKKLLKKYCQKKSVVWWNDIFKIFILRMDMQPSEFPRLLMITGSDPRHREEFLNKIILHINNGVTLIQLRAKELDKIEYTVLAKYVIDIGRKHHAKIILNSDIEIAEKLDSDGVHLSSKILMKCNKRPLTKTKIIAAACHNLKQLKHAEKIGVDIVTLSPVCRTNTHPDATPLGWNLFYELSQSIAIPIYALGGLSERDLDVALSYRAHGIASISSLWCKQYK